MLLRMIVMGICILRYNYDLTRREATNVVINRYLAYYNRSY